MSEPIANYDECLNRIKNALGNARAGGGTGLFLVIGQLEYTIECWPKADKEMARLMKFENDARNVLMGGFGIEKAAWKNADGSEVFIRCLDDKDVLNVLGCPPR